jgi:molybdopterin-guanine dinucleotide biosynthesis protein A
VRGAILAGGTASRFGGQPKGLEQVGGERILDRVTRALEAATGQPPILIANAAEASEWRPDLTVIADAIRNCGSLGGIYTALIAGEGPVLVLAWDMPFVPVELLEEMIRRSEGRDAALPERADASGVEPLCGIYAPACTEQIRKRIAEEDFRATGFLDAVDLATLSLHDVSRFGDPATIFFNVNTPADLSRAQELWRDTHEQ